jgi:GDP-L-fucose synthase
MIAWPNTRVLVTGGAGFLGGYVVDRLRERGARDVFVPRSRDYDLVDGQAVRRLLSDTQPHLVVHLAARVGGIGANRANPATFFYDNIMMGVQLLHESQQTGVQKFVAVGTVCGYPKFCPLPLREEDLWEGYPEETNAPYGIAKKVLSVQSAAYRGQHGFNSVVLYPANFYGPKDNFDVESGHVIPAMMRKFHEAKVGGRDVVILWGDGSPTREFLYVEDCAEGVVAAAERYDSSDPLNLGSGREISVAELAAMIARLVGYTGHIEWDASRPNGQPRRRLDLSRARDRLGFLAKTSLEDGLARTYAWMARATASSQ